MLNEGHREQVLSWLISRFTSVSLRDEWLFASIAMLDRLACCGGAFGLSSCLSEKDVKAEALAVVLVALKISPAEMECGLDHKGILLAICGKSPPDLSERDFWYLILKAEFTVCRLLQFCTAVPTALELSARVASDVIDKAKQAGIGASRWAALAKGRLPAPKKMQERPETRYALLVYYLVELAMVHAPFQVYQGPPFLLALGMLQLALFAFGYPPLESVEFLDSLNSILTHGQIAWLPKLKAKVVELWNRPPAGSEVAKKWETREASGKLGGTLPKPARASALFPNAQAIVVCQPLMKPQEQTPKPAPKVAMETPQKHIRRRMSLFSTPQPATQLCHGHVGEALDIDESEKDVEDLNPSTSSQQLRNPV